MGKASSSKKVARAARAASSSRPGERRNLGFPLVVALIVLLGIGLVAFARSSREVSAAPRIGDHWHSGYDFFVCDDYIVEPIATIGDGLGIHSHGDGLMHIHPESGVTSGKGATLARWFASFGGTIDDSGVTLDTGERIEAGADCNGEPTVFKVLRYDASDLRAAPEVITSGVASTRFLKNLEFFVFAFVPEGAELPPPSAARLEILGSPLYTDPNDLTGPVSTTIDGTEGADADDADAGADADDADADADDAEATTTTGAG